MRVETHHDPPTDKSTSGGWETVSHSLSRDRECTLGGWQKGYATVCKTVDAGSIPALPST